MCTYENGPGRKTCEMCDTNLKEARIKTPIPTLLGMYVLTKICLLFDFSKRCRKTIAKYLIFLFRLKKKLRYTL